MTRLLPLIALLVVTACKKDDYAQLYATEDKAPSLEWDDIEAMDHMGPVLIDDGVNFVVWSERAERIDLLLFDDPESELPVQQFEMTRTADVWTLYVEGIGLGQHYGFVAWGPNWIYDEEWQPGQIDGFQADVDAAGNRFDPNKLLFDPWSKALHRDHDWSKGSTATGPARTESTWAAATKSIVIDIDTYDWSAAETEWREMRKDADAEGHGWDDLIIYEVHPKGFTMNPASGVDHPGTFRGIGEHAKYLQDLGITAVELLPIHEKPLDGGYWGYNNNNFFAPEMTYSAAFNIHGEPDEVIDEFKWMVDQLHQHDIEVIVDVVYNHTGEGGFWREKMYYNDVDYDPGSTAESYNMDPKEVVGLYSFRGFDNHGWYALTADNQEYWGNTGVGNQTRPNYAPMERMIMDSLHFYVEEMHVDGFRFDLAGVLGEIDGDYNNWDGEGSVLQKIIDDPVIQENNVRIIAEPWTAGGWYGPLIGDYPGATENPDQYGWQEWNARFRDTWRAFINYDDWTLSSMEADANVGFILMGSHDYYADEGRGAHTSINFFTSHDGMTMYDLFTYEHKQNGCSVLNPICCDDPTSPWCQTDNGDDHNRSRNWGEGNEDIKRQLMRNAFVGMLISHGTPMLLGGDEWLRTQYGNNNAFSTWADNEWNWFRWGEWQATTSPERHRMHDFVREMITFRKEHTYALAPTEWDGGMPHSWNNASNTGDPDWGGKHLMLHYYDDGSWNEPEIAILINMETSATIDFTLPTGRTWYRVADTQSWYDSETYFAGEPTADEYVSQNIDTAAPLEITTATYGVPARTIVILESD